MSLCFFLNRVIFFLIILSRVLIFSVFRVFPYFVYSLVQSKLLLYNGIMVLAPFYKNALSPATLVSLNLHYTTRPFLYGQHETTLRNDIINLKIKSSRRNIFATHFNGLIKIYSFAKMYKFEIKDSNFRYLCATIIAEVVHICVLFLLLDFFVVILFCWNPCHNLNRFFTEFILTQRKAATWFSFICG